MRSSLLAEEGHEFFSFPRFNKPALKVGTHLRFRSVATLPHGDRSTRHMPHRLCDAATAPRVARINASLVRMFHVKQLMARGHSPTEELTARAHSVPLIESPMCRLMTPF